MKTTLIALLLALLLVLTIAATAYVTDGSANKECVREGYMPLKGNCR